MDLSQALPILEALADGYDPLTGQVLGADHLCQQPQVVRALCWVVQALHREMPRALSEAEHDHAGKPWTAAEEAELVRAFEAGAGLAQLSVRHGRTRQAIQGRLYRLGKVPAWRPTSRQDRRANGISPPAVERPSESIQVKEGR